MLSVLTRLWRIWLGVSLDRGPIDIRGYLRRLRSFTIKPPTPAVGAGVPRDHAYQGHQWAHENY